MAKKVQPLTQARSLKPEQVKRFAKLESRLRLFLQNDESHFRDPLDCVAKDLIAADAELVSFIVAGLSYGRVEQIQKSSFNLLERLSVLDLNNPFGHGLSDYLKNESLSQLQKNIPRALKGWKHRLNTEGDLSALLSRLSVILKEHGSLARLYQASHAENPKLHLTQFVKNLVGDKAPSTRKKSDPWLGTGLQWFAPSPTDGGTCKRMLMWLRWMIRKDSIDRGYWQHAELLNAALAMPHPRNLFVPVDTHIMQWAQKEGIISSPTPTWKTVELISDFFKALNSDDPLRYDFMLCHEGMKSFRMKQNG